MYFISRWPAPLEFISVNTCAMEDAYIKVHAAIRVPLYYPFQMTT